MNKEKYEKFLKKTYIPLTKNAIDTNILLTFIANVVLYYFFRNIIVTAISSILFIVFSVTLIKNRYYIREYESTLLVKTCLFGYWFWLLLIFDFLMQMYFKISIWFFLVELLLLIFSFLLAKNTINKMFEENEYSMHFDEIQKMPKVGAKIGGIVYSITVIVTIPFVESFAWYFISAIVFVFVSVACYTFTIVLIIYIGFLKYYAD